MIVATYNNKNVLVSAEYFIYYQKLLNLFFIFSTKEN